MQEWDWNKIDIDVVLFFNFHHLKLPRAARAPATLRPFLNTAATESPTCKNVIVAVVRPQIVADDPMDFGIQPLFEACQILIVSERRRHANLTRESRP